MISVLASTPKSCRNGNWGGGAPFNSRLDAPQHDFGVASHPQAASKWQLG